MRLEAARAFATFLRKGGSRELGIADDLREECALALEGSSAPEVVSWFKLLERSYVSSASQLPASGRTLFFRPRRRSWTLENRFAVTNF
jgi:hypothetical protein